MNARDFDLYAGKPLLKIRQLQPFSPFRYLFLLMPIPFFAWYWANQALHRLELEWLRAHPNHLRSLAQACEVASGGVCEVHARAAGLYAGA